MALAPNKKPWTSLQSWSHPLDLAFAIQPLHPGQHPHLGSRTTQRDITFLLCTSAEDGSSPTPCPRWEATQNSELIKASTWRRRECSIW